jgi:hypothetical protein
MQAKFADEMRQMREMMVERKRPQGDDDPAIIAMKAQTEAMQKQMEDQRRQLEAERAESRHREEMRTLQENSQRQIDALKELITQSTANKEDPQMRMLVELQRQSFDSQKEATRHQAEATRESTRLAAEQPRTMVEMMERLKSASGSEQMLNNIANAYKGVNDMQMGVMEMMSNMGQSPGMALAEGALASGKEVLERFIQGKQAEAVAKEHTEQVKAQRDATAYQAQAQVAHAAAGSTPQVEYAEPDALAGGAEPVSDPGSDPAQDPNMPAEAKIFGPLYGEVLQLREAIGSDSVSPEQVAQIIVEAAQAIQEHNLAVPVFSLLGEQRYAEMIDLLLPDVPSEFSGECVTALIAKLRDMGIEPGKPHVDLDAPPSGTNAASA